MKKTRLMIVFGEFKSGGGEREAISLLNGLDNRKFEKSLVCCSVFSSLTSLVRKNVTIVDLGHHPRWFFPVSIISFYRNLLKDSPDIVISMMGRASLMTTIATIFLPKKPKHIIWHHALSSRWLIFQPHRKIQQGIIKYLYPLCHRVITITQAIKKDLHQNFGINPDKIIVLPSMVDLDYIKKQAGKKLFAAILPNRLVISFIGRLVKGKKIDILLKAFSQLSNIENNPLLIIAGSGPEKIPLMKLAKRLKIEKEVKFVGLLKNPYPLFRRSNVIVAASQTEGRSHTILESMACKTPVVTTKYPGIEECIIHEKTGLISSKNNSADLSNQVRNILSSKSLSRGIIRRAAEFVKQFDSKKVVKYYQEILIA